MPKTTNSNPPGVVLQKHIDDYQTNPFALSKSLGVNYQTVTHIISGKARITPQMAIRLSKYFTTTPEFWLDLQSQSEIAELLADKKFTSQLNKITKAVKPTGKKTKEPKAASKIRKRTTINPAVPKKAAKVKSRQKVKKFKTSRAKK